MFNKTLFEAGLDIHPVFVQQDGDSDVTGDWMNVENYDRVYLLLRKAGSEDVDDGSLTILQATDNAAAGSKVCAVRRCWYKTGTMTAQGVWTAVTLTTNASVLCFGATATAGTRVVADVNTSPLYLLVEVLASDLDINNGFKFITGFLTGADVNNAALYTCDAIFHGGALAGAIPVDPLS
jgi:hypothetical protein